MVPFCEKCRPDDREYTTAPCANCGREVNNSERRWKPRLWYFCSEACQQRHQSTHQAAVARQQRAEACGPSRACVEFGEHFEPSRADAQFCSARCKQKAYRKRVTEAKSASMRRIC